MNGKTLKMTICFAVALILAAGLGFSATADDPDYPATGATKKVRVEKKSEQVRGMVEIATNGKPFLVMDWETRSRVSLEVTGKLRGKFAALKGNVVLVRGVVEKTGEWTGSIDVTEIIQNKLRERSMGNRTAKFKTTLGNFTVELFEDKAPITTKNFIDLAQKGFYNGVIFHRVIDGFMVQTGDPKGTGMGGPGYTIQDEFHKDLRHSGEGVLSMANTGRPNTGGSQFFITLAATDWLDGKHAVFGKVIEGMDVVRKIGKTQTGPGDRPVQDIVIQELKIEG